MELTVKELTLVVRGLYYNRHIMQEELQEHTERNDAEMVQLVKQEQEVNEQAISKVLAQIAVMEGGVK